MPPTRQSAAGGRRRSPGRPRRSPGGSPPGSTRPASWRGTSPRQGTVPGYSGRHSTPSPSRPGTWPAAPGPPLRTPPPGRACPRACPAAPRPAGGQQGRRLRRPGTHRRRRCPAPQASRKPPARPPAQDTSGAAQPPPASPQQPASDSPGAQAREAASPAPAPDLTNADPGAAPQAMPPGDAAPQSADPGEDTSAQAEETRTLTLADLTGPSPDWMSASLCEGCGKLHGGDCPAPVTAPPPGLHGDDDELTPLGAVVEDAARYLAMRGYLGPDADGGVPAWVLAELAEIAHEKPCGGPGCSATADGFLSPSPAADHFLQRGQQEWERWLPRWACTCGRTFKVCPEPPGTAFYAITPDGMLGDLAGHVTPDAKRRTVKDSGACPGCGRLFADTIAGGPVTPRADAPAPSGSQEPAPTLFDSDTAGSTTGPGHTAGQEAARANGQETPQPGNPATDSPAAAASATTPDATAPGPQPEPLPAADPYTDPGQAQADYRKAVHDYMEMGYTKGRPHAGPGPAQPPAPGHQPPGRARARRRLVRSQRAPLIPGVVRRRPPGSRRQVHRPGAGGQRHGPQPRRRQVPRPEIPGRTRHLHRLGHPAGQPHPGHRPEPRRLGERVREQPRQDPGRWHGDRPATTGPGRRDSHDSRPRRTRRRRPGHPRCGSAAQHGPRRRTGPHARRGVRPVAEHGRHARERATWTTSVGARARRRPPAETASRSR